MRCPECGSANVLEIDNLHTWWACGDCGYQGDGADFDDNPDEPDYDDGLPDWADFYPTWHDYMIHEYPEAFCIHDPPS